MLDVHLDVEAQRRVLPAGEARRQHLRQPDRLVQPPQRLRPEVVHRQPEVPLQRLAAALRELLHHGRRHGDLPAVRHALDAGGGVDDGAVVVVALRHGVELDVAVPEVHPDAHPQPVPNAGVVPAVVGRVVFEGCARGLEQRRCLRLAGERAVGGGVGAFGLLKLGEATLLGVGNQLLVRLVEDVRPPVVVVEDRLQRAREVDGVPRVLERAHEAISDGLHLVAPVLRDQLTDELVVRINRRAHVRWCSCPQGCAALDVSEHHGERLRGVLRRARVVTLPTVGEEARDAYDCADENQTRRSRCKRVLERLVRRRDKQRVETETAPARVPQLEVALVRDGGGVVGVDESAHPRIEVPDVKRACALVALALVARVLIERRSVAARGVGERTDEGASDARAEGTRLVHLVDRLPWRRIARRGVGGGDVDNEARDDGGVGERRVQHHEAARVLGPHLQHGGKVPRAVTGPLPTGALRRRRIPGQQRLHRVVEHELARGEDDGSAAVRVAPVKQLPHCVDVLRRKDDGVVDRRGAHELCETGDDRDVVQFGVRQAHFCLRRVREQRQSHQRLLLVVVHRAR
mmetsp:Transcript_21815/g.67728  ORF Transcript_21815/g.67728 Transcript_21815/m.67728 type:complete len:576 (-) Transcript_21815:668-2395(-)